MSNLSDMTNFVTEPLADLTGAPRTDFQEAFGPELVALGIQIPMNLGLSRGGEWIGSLVAGLATLGYAVLAKPNERMRRDMFELSGHFFNRVVTARPEDLSQIMQDIQTFNVGIRTGNAQAVRASMIRTPEEVTSLVRNLQVQSQALLQGFGSPSPPQQAMVTPQYAQRRDIARPGVPILHGDGRTTYAGPATTVPSILA